MKLILISDTWDPDSNSVSDGLWKLFNAIEGLGHNVFVIQPGMFEKPVEVDGFRLVKDAKYVEFILRNLRFDAIHIATEGPLGARARKYCLKNSISFTTTYNSAIPYHLKEKWKIPMWLSNLYLKEFHSKSNQVYVSNLQLQTELQDRGYKRLSHVSWNLPNPPETAKFLQSLAFKFEALQDE